MQREYCKALLMALSSNNPTVVTALENHQAMKMNDDMFIMMVKLAHAHDGAKLVEQRILKRGILDWGGGYCLQVGSGFPGIWPIEILINGKLFDVIGYETPDELIEKLLDSLPDIRLVDAAFALATPGLKVDGWSRTGRSMPSFKIVEVRAPSRLLVLPEGRSKPQWIDRVDLQAIANEWGNYKAGLVRRKWWSQRGFRLSSALGLLHLAERERSAMRVMDERSCN